MDLSQLANYIYSLLASYMNRYVTGFAKMCIVHTKILIRFFDPAYSYTQ